MDVGRTRVGGALQPPPTKRSAHFLNPLIEEASDESSEEAPEVLVPPDVIDEELDQHLSGLRLLLHDTFAATHVRFCAGVPLPKHLLKSVDVGWVIRHRNQEKDADKGHEGKGKKNLENVNSHRNNPVVIDSPRSLLVLLKSGLGPEALAPGIDTVTENRKQKVIQQLQREYKELCEKVSQGCVVRYLASRATVSPIRDRSTEREREGGSPAPGSKYRIKDKHLDHLLQHRDLITAEWGLRQQKLANEVYLNERIEVLKAHMADAKRTLTPIPKRAATPIKESPAAATPNPHNATSSTSERLNSSVIQGSRGLTMEEKMRRQKKREEMKQHQKDIEAERFRAIDEKLRLKEVAALEASERRAQKRKEITEAQRRKAIEVKEVGDRMKRTEAYVQLQLARRLEEDAFRSKCREEELRQQKIHLQELQRHRKCLTDATNEFLKQTSINLEKALTKQEAHVQLPHPGRSRTGEKDERDGKLVEMKMASKDLLQRVLRKEDEIIAKWKHLENSDSVV